MNERKNEIRADRNGIGDSKIGLMRNVDRRRLRAFFASLLWRCHVSTLQGFSLVDIGQKYERLIRDELLQERTLKHGNYDYIDAVAFSFTSIAHECLTMPFKKRYCVSGLSANGYTLQLPHLEFRVSIDQRRNPYDCGRVCFGAIVDEMCDGAMSLHEEYAKDNLLVFQTKLEFRSQMSAYATKSLMPRDTLNTGNAIFPKRLLPSARARIGRMTTLRGRRRQG